MTAFQMPDRMAADPDAIKDLDPIEVAVKRLKRAQELIARFTGDNPSIPSIKAMDEVYELLHQVINPDGNVGVPVIDNGPDYPTKWLPDPMAAQLEARGSLHEGGVGAGMFGCASAACLPSELVVDGTRRVPPTLWIPSIGAAGCGKTPAHEIVFEPYRQREDQAARRYVASMGDWVALDRKERKEMPKPINDTRLSDDATIEVVARRLNTPSGALALVADELSGLLSSIGQYKKDGGGDKARFLSLWSAKAWYYERVGSGEDPIFIHIERPILPIFGTIQPEFISLLGDVGSGMQARWMPHLCGSRVGTAIGKPADEWVAAVDVLLRQLDRRRRWDLSTETEAFAEHEQAEQRWADERRDTSQTPASTSFLAIGGEHDMRAALVVAEMDAAGWAAKRGGPIGTGELPVWAVRAGIDLVDYCAGVWRTLPGNEAPISRNYAEKAIVERDGRLNAWLKDHGGKATRREIQRARVAGCRTADDVDALIARHRAIYGEASVVPVRGGVEVFAR